MFFLWHISTAALITTQLIAVILLVHILYHFSGSAHQFLITYSLPLLFSQSQRTTHSSSPSHLEVCELLQAVKGRGCPCFSKLWWRM